MTKVPGMTRMYTIMRVRKLATDACRELRRTSMVAQSSLKRNHKNVNVSLFCYKANRLKFRIIKLILDMLDR